MCSGAGSCTFECEDGYHLNDLTKQCDRDECSGSETKCENRSSSIGYMKRCSGGKFDSTACPNHYSCNASGTACGDCNNGTQTCSNDGSGIGVVQKCSNGAYSSSNCTGVSCNGNECGSCINGSVRCNGNTAFETCINGIWNKTKDCNRCVDNMCY